MKFTHRLIYYGIGLVMGIIVVIFFFGKKNTSFDYGPNARVLKNIRIKQRLYSLDALKSIQSNGIDTSSVSTILSNGNVVFSKSNIQVDSCKLYIIEGTKDLKHVTLLIKNCDNTAIIDAVTIK